MGRREASGVVVKLLTLTLFNGLRCAVHMDRIVAANEVRNPSDDQLNTMVWIEGGSPQGYQVRDSLDSILKQIERTVH